MIYLDDIIELIEDVPDELQRRGSLIQDWERQASEYKKEADKLTLRLDTDKSLRDEDKAKLFRQISEALDAAREITEKKCEMASKCHQLLQMLDEKVSDWSYHCKLELEVDCPGASTRVENSFTNESAMVAAAMANLQNGGPVLGQQDLHQREFRVPQERHESRDRVGSSSISRESTPMTGYGGRIGNNYGAVGGRRERTRDSRDSMSSSRSNSMAPYDLTAATAHLQQQAARKRKRDRQRERERDQLALLQQAQQLQAAGAAVQQPAAGQQKMSAYMRKKKEREREERKLREVHANRERSGSRQRVIKPEPMDDGYEQMAYHHQQQQRSHAPPIGRPRGPGRPPGSRTQANQYSVPPAYASPPPAPAPRRDEPLMERRDEQQAHQQQDDITTGGMSDFDDEDHLLEFLNNEMPGGIDDHDQLKMDLGGENIFESLGAELDKEFENVRHHRAPSPLNPNLYGVLNAPSKSTAAGGSSSRYDNKSTSKAERKRQQQAAALSQQVPQPQYVAYGATESLHGRQRRPTQKMATHAYELSLREEARRLKEEEMAAYGGEYSVRSRDSRDRSTAGGDVVMAEEAEDNELYCYCKMPSDDTMVGCDGDDCPWNGWFHLSCLGLTRAPSEQTWFCQSCRDRPRRR